MESLPRLTGQGPLIEVRSVKVTGAMSREHAIVGLADALPHIQQAVKQSEADGKAPSGWFSTSFRTEPNGMIRMVLEGENHLVGGKPGGVADGFAGSTMGRKWRFPASEGPSLIEVEFAVGQP